MLLRNHFIEAVPARLQQLNYVIIFVSDMQRSVAFYRDLLGLPLKFSSPERTEFVTSTTTLARHPARSTSQGDQAAAAAGQAQLGFMVDDLMAFYTSLQAQGVRFSLPPKEERDAGKIAVLHDPDGFGITIRQA